MNHPDSNHARLAAARHLLLKLKKVDPETVTITDAGYILVDGVPLDLRMSFRVTLLALTILDCLGHVDQDRSQIDEFKDVSPYREDMAWLDKHLDQDQFLEIVWAFVELRGGLDTDLYQGKWGPVLT